MFLFLTQKKKKKNEKSIHRLIGSLPFCEAHFPIECHSFSAMFARISIEFALNRIDVRINLDDLLAHNFRIAEKEYTNWQHENETDKNVHSIFILSTCVYWITSCDIKSILIEYQRQQQQQRYDDKRWKEKPWMFYISTVKFRVYHHHHHHSLFSLFTHQKWITKILLLFYYWSLTLVT